jgi:2-polyprenyl-6-methoxyphenol hydroxylase-like FAD-dependent oxidoreductase
MRRAIVIGGSLGGLSAGCTLLRSGWDVTIVERTKERLEGRGAGLVVHPLMLQGLLAAGARVDTGVGVAISGRTAFNPDGSIAGELPMPQFCTSWARLYTLLSEVFPEERVRRGVGLASVEQNPDGVAARLEDGTLIRGDVLVAADGVRSTVRRQLFPDVELAYAGYIAWRGMVEEGALPPAAHGALFGTFGWGLLEGEHILGYPVPGPNDDVRPGRRYYNFVWYRPVDAATALPRMLTDATGRLHADGIPPHLIRPEVMATLRHDATTLLSPAWREMVLAVPQPLFQPIGDLESPAMCRGRIALLGDAAFVARPHVGMGAIKAGTDAMVLAEALADGDVEKGLLRYDAVRGPASRALVARSRWLGAYIEGKRRRPDALAFMQENSGVDSASRCDGGLFFRLLEEVGFG